MMHPVTARDVEALLMFGDANELVRLSPMGEIIRFGAASPDMAALVKKATQSLNTAVKKNIAPIIAPVGGQFVVKAPTKAASAKISVTAPKLPQLAPAATKPKPAPAATKPAVSLVPAGMTAPTAAGKAQASSMHAYASTPAGAAAIAAAAKVETAGGKSTPKPAPAATAPVKASGGVNAALTGNFLEPGSAPLAMPNVKLPSFTAEQIKATEQAFANIARAREQAADDKRVTALAQVRNEQAADQKYEQEQHKRLMADPGPEGQAYRARYAAQHSAGIDWGLIPMGAKVLATGAAIIASGGAAAGAVGLTAAGGSLAAAAAADRLVAAVEKGAEIGKQAKGVIDEAKAAYAKGDEIARTAVDTLNKVARERIEKAIPKGVEQTLSATAKKAYDTVASSVTAGVADKVVGQVRANLRAAGAAQAAAPSSPSSGFVTALTSNTRPRPVAVANVNPGLTQMIASLDLGTPRPRWFVSDAAKVSNLYRVAAPATPGWVVWSTGELVRQ